MSVRAFVDGERAPELGASLELDDDESHYLLKVRRLRIGDALELLDGRGRVWRASLTAIGRRARVQVDATIERGLALPERVLLLGLPEAPATLEALTLASELAATQVVLIGCARSQGHAPAPARVERVLRASMRQCGRPTPPRVHGLDVPWTLADALAHESTLAGVFGDPEDGFDAWHMGPAGLRALVGPEGGLTEQERDAALAAGFARVQLGPWILRTPTAVAALLARAWPPQKA